VCKCVCLCKCVCVSVRVCVCARVRFMQVYYLIIVPGSLNFGVPKLAAFSALTRPIYTEGDETTFLTQAWPSHAPCAHSTKKLTQA